MQTMRPAPHSTPTAQVAAPTPQALGGLNEEALRALAHSLLERIATEAKHSTQLIDQQRAELLLRQTRIDALTHEIRVLRHLRFAAKTEAMNAPQAQLFKEANEEDIAAAQQRLEQLCPPTRPAPSAKAAPKRQALPAHLPRTEVRLEPQNTACGCGQPMRALAQPHGVQSLPGGAAGR